ncbi:MAG: hypothetical protein SPL30_01340 [Succinivibrio sp.]|jgi:hypothetical protein|nr:hypothetical protein [Succinivibrio sp.]
MFNFLTSKTFLGFAAGVVIGAVGYKLVADKKINPKALQRTVSDLASKFAGGGNGNGNGNAGSQGRGGHGKKA